MKSLARINYKKGYLIQLELRNRFRERINERIQILKDEIPHAFGDESRYQIYARINELKLLKEYL